MSETDVTKFTPKTVYVTYIAATPEKVWQALIDPQFTTRYFFGFAVEIDDARRRARVRRHRGVRTHREDPVAGRGDGLCNRECGVDRDDLAILEYQVGGPARRR